MAMTKLKALVEASFTTIGLLRQNEEKSAYNVHAENYEFV